MSDLKLKRVEKFIIDTFSDTIWMDDYKDKKEDDRAQALKSRGIAAMSIMHRYGVDVETASACIVDGYKDNGIDAVYCDNMRNELFLVQSKWSSSGTKTIELGDFLKFTNGIDKLLNLDIEEFEDRLKSKKTELESAILNAKWKIIINVCYSSDNKISDEINKSLKEFMDRHNNNDDIMNHTATGISDLYSVARGDGTGPVNEDISLVQFSKSSHADHEVYCGQISAALLADLYEKHQSRLFAKNIRSLLQNSDINSGIIDTLKNDPERFFCFNNGITMVASEIHKKPYQGANRDFGIFECANISIVNGAQTVGACHRAKHNGIAVDSAFIPIKIINVGNCDDTFVDLITRRTNTQNRIERRDFVSLDPYQRKIQEDLENLGIRYTYKSGDDTSDSKNTIDLNTATLSLAAYTQNPDLIAIAKREIGLLWDTKDDHKYKKIFSTRNNAYVIANCTSVYRATNDAITSLTQNGTARQKQYAVHGNVIFPSIVFSYIEKSEFHKTIFNYESFRQICIHNASPLFDAVFNAGEAAYPSAYLAHLFRNSSKVQYLIKSALDVLEFQEPPAANT
ncbi:hypothetical protein DA2_3943 [Desulfovibrio sp. A2]|nr:hypothetical protein DA2_3943 [Desulfovibrio sp. A2]